MKKVLLSAVLLADLFCSFAQVSVDPTDRFYSQAQGWELKGYISALPQIRPYPSNLIKSILEEVIDKGDKLDREFALYEYERIFGKSLNLYVAGDGEYKASQNLTEETDKGTKNVKGEGGIAGEIVFNPYISAGYDLGMYAEVTDYEDIAPLYKNKAPDSVFDSSSIGPIALYLDWNTNVAVGTNEYYAIAGLSKTGYGSFLNDGLALNDTSFHSANLIMNVTRKKWSYSSVFEIIGATTNNPYEYSDHSDGKYLSFHSINYRFNDFINVSYYENIVFGPNMNISYLFPVPYMPIQNIGGANDNLQMGLVLNIKPANGLLWSTDIFVDDIEVNDIVKLNFDTKIRVAGQTGLVFAPSNTSCKKIGLNYQIVLTYVYAHWEYGSDDSGEIFGATANRQNYTNAGVNIGSALDPNSDKVSFYAQFSPKPFMRFGFATNFIRHANSAEAFDDDDAAEYVLAKEGQYATDGSAYMHQMFSDPDGTSGTHVDQAWENLGFMTSDHKMAVMQAGLTAEIDLPKTRGGQLTFLAGYTFEYVKNSGVNKNIYKGIGFEPYTVPDAEGKETTYYRFNGKSSLTKDELYAEAKNEAAKQKSEWIENLTDKVNHYFTLGFRYTY